VCNIVNKISIPTARGTESFDSFVTTISELINAFVENNRRNYGFIRVHVLVDAIFTRDVENGSQRIAAYFPTPNNSTYNLSPVTSLHRLTTKTLEAAALY